MIPGDPRQAGKPLSKRERQVAQALVEVDSEQQVADMLRVSLRTVQFHTSNIRTKLDVHSTRRALFLLLANGVVTV